MQYPQLGAFLSRLTSSLWGAGEEQRVLFGVRVGSPLPATKGMELSVGILCMVHVVTSALLGALCPSSAVPGSTSWPPLFLGLQEMTGQWARAGVWERQVGCTPSVSRGISSSCTL